MMILEGIVTTLDRNGRLNIAPMGPQVEPDGSLARFLLRPFRTSTTYSNLKATGEGVLHVTDDVELLARAAIGRLDPEQVATRPARIVRGRVLTSACRICEFRVVALDDQEDRTAVVAEAVAVDHFRDFFGFNRAKHAVVEAAILATRTAILPIGEILNEFRKLAVLVHKTGGPAEHDAFAVLDAHVRAEATARGIDPDHS